MPKRVICRQRLPSSEEANLILLQRRSEGWRSKFHELYDHLTPDQWLYPRGVSAPLSAATAAKHLQL